MTLPTVVPPKYNATVSDFLIVKADKSGAARMEPFISSVGAAAAIGTVIGLVPFRKGARLVQEASYVQVGAAAAGAATTASIGVIYNDNVTYANNATLYATGVTLNTANARVATTSSVANVDYTTLDDGWFVITTAGAITVNAMTLHGQIVLSYDPVN